MRILIGTCYKDSAPAEYVESLANMIAYTVAQGHEVTYKKAYGGLYDARNRICNSGIKGKYDYVLQIDSDQTFPEDALCRMLDRKVDICTGVYVGKEDSHRPVLFTSLHKDDSEGGASSAKNGLKKLFDEGGEFFKLPPTGGCGAGFLLTSVHALKLVKIHKHYLFDIYDGLGEDVSFCQRCNELGFPIYVDNSFKIGHIKYTCYDLDDWDGTENMWVKDDALIPKKISRR